MNRKIFLVLGWLLVCCMACKDDAMRFSFTLDFSISPSHILSVGDTLLLTSSHADRATDYYSGYTEQIPVRYFDTEIVVLQLGHYEDGSNCRIATEALHMEVLKGSLQDNLLGFAHSDAGYELLLRIIPASTGVYALLLSDTEEIRKVFDGNYNRHLLNAFNIYELKLGSNRIPIDERVAFFWVE